MSFLCPIDWHIFFPGGFDNFNANQDTSGGGWLDQLRLRLSQLSTWSWSLSWLKLSLATEEQTEWQRHFLSCSSQLKTFPTKCLPYPCLWMVICKREPQGEGPPELVKIVWTTSSVTPGDKWIRLSPKHGHHHPHISSSYRSVPSSDNLHMCPNFWDFNQIFCTADNMAFWWLHFCHSFCN